ncbi:hypothetical protein WI88_02750 [Burkholderia ubonensis]|nr:hypothetical protein WI88_02750 [Burkholderia ubonensis]
MRMFADKSDEYPYEYMMKRLELLDRPALSEQELVDVARDIRTLYWTEVPSTALFRGRESCPDQ